MIFTGFEDYGLLVLRIALGAIFLYHGLPKLLDSHGKAKGMGMSSMTVFIVGLFEALGGLGVLLGAYTDIAGIMIALVMVGALYFKIAKWKVPFSTLTAMGWEFDLILIASAVMLVLVGPGVISLDVAYGLW